MSAGAQASAAAEIAMTMLRSGIRSVSDRAMGKLLERFLNNSLNAARITP